MRGDVTVHHLPYLWWSWGIRSRTNRPSNFSISHISVTIQDTDLFLIKMREDVTRHHLPYLWWPWKNRSRSNQPLKFSISYTDLWLITLRDDVTVHHLAYLWWPWEIRSRSSQTAKFSIGRISVTVKGADLWLTTICGDFIKMREDVTRHHLPYLWWPWKNRSRSNRPLQFSDISKAQVWWPGGHHCLCMI